VNKNCIEIIKNVSKIELINDIYTECFEAQFLQETEAFYRQQTVPSFEPKRLIEDLKIVNILIKSTDSALYIYSLIIGR